MAAWILSPLMLPLSSTIRPTHSFVSTTVSRTHRSSWSNSMRPARLLPFSRAARRVLSMSILKNSSPYSCLLQAKPSLMPKPSSFVACVPGWAAARFSHMRLSTYRASAAGALRRDPDPVLVDLDQVLFHIFLQAVPDVLRLDGLFHPVHHGELFFEAPAGIRPPDTLPEARRRRRRPRAFEQPVREPFLQVLKLSLLGLDRAAELFQSRPRVFPGLLMQPL